MPSCTVLGEITTASLGSEIPWTEEMRQATDLSARIRVGRDVEDTQEIMLDMLCRGHKGKQVPGQRPLG